MLKTEKAVNSMTVDSFSDRIRFGSLYGTYGALLTKKQQQCLELYFCEDYSLAEIAEEMRVSRQAVHDLLKRVEQTLEHYEKILGFLQHMEHRQKLIADALALVQAAEKDGAAGSLSRVRDILQELKNESR